MRDEESASFPAVKQPALVSCSPSAPRSARRTPRDSGRHAQLVALTQRLTSGLSLFRLHAGLSRV
jgi:hypothetical protein